MKGQTGIAIVAVVLVVVVVKVEDQGIGITLVEDTTERAEFLHLRY